MTINELAKKHHITPATIRHYEKFGLLDETHVTRQPNDYREFTPLASQRLELIKLGQHVGFSLQEMTTQLRHWDTGMSGAVKKRILSEQLYKIEAKIREFKHTKRFIEHEIAKNCD
jgi:DNA-binding transcriptional MerR regulator